MLPAPPLMGAEPGDCFLNPCKAISETIDQNPVARLFPHQRCDPDQQGFNLSAGPVGKRAGQPRTTL